MAKRHRIGDFDDTVLIKLEGRQMSYWWMRFDYGEFKVPRPTGKIVLLIDMLAPGLEMNPKGMSFRFEDSKRDTRTIGDFAPYMGFTFFASQKACDVFGPMFEKCGRSWPMIVSKHPYQFVFIQAIEEGFDYEKSEFHRSEETGFITQVMSIRLSKEFQSKYDIFRLAGEPDITANLIVSERFRERYEHARLTGLFFTPVE